jgi:exosortase family protein XrtM
MPPLSYEEFLRREREPPRMGQAATILIFLAMFFGLQWAWEQAHETAVERLVIDQATVKPSAWLAGLITPEINPYADGARLKAQGGGINILNGCEGTDVLFLLIAAFSVAPLFLRQRLWGLLLGVLLVYVFNQIRILALFYAWRTDRGLFEMLHGYLAPLVLVTLVGIYFHLWLQLHRPRADPV